MIRLFYTCAVCAVLLLMGTELPAAPKRAPAAGKTPVAAPPPLDPETQTAIAGLQSSNPEEVIVSIQTLAIAGAPAAAAPLGQLLSTRPRTDITDMIIGALGVLQQPESLDALLPYLQHRRPETRLAALFALSNYSDPRLVVPIEVRLRDSDSHVRSAAAVALRNIGSAATVPLLFQAFEKGVYDAIGAIGRHGDMNDAERVAGYLGRISVELLLPGFKEFLARTDFPESGKLALLDHLFELAGPEVYQFTVAYKASFPPETTEETSALLKKTNQMLRQIAEK